jgi:hypothetical protein
MHSLPAFRGSRRHFILAQAVPNDLGQVQAVGPPPPLRIGDAELRSPLAAEERRLVRFYLTGRPALRITSANASG